MTHGEIIRDRRKQLRMTQDDVARAVGTTKATVSRWESGDILKIGMDMAARLSDVLGLDPGLFLWMDEVLLPGELTILYHYRDADEGTQAAVRKLLDIDDEGW